MRNALLILGLLLLAVLWLGPLPGATAHSFSAHMALHMGIVAVTAPLLALGLAGRRFDPARRIPSLFSPIPLSLLELVVVWVWHAPALHRAARADGLMLVLEQGSFLLCGLLLWLSVLGGDPTTSAHRSGSGVVALLLTSMHMTLLGALLALTPRPLYAHHSSIDDQHMGGAIMLLVGGLSYLAGGLGLTFKLLQQRVAGERV